ncbi:MAG TPA: hypothetical protein VNT24_02145 [Propionibacteriaceae bacterium]|nr:hypothetical protein [Propionibacteriaceae bacterium]
MDPAVTFALDQYEPVAFHTYPALMRAAEARTELLRPPEPVVNPTALVEPQVRVAEPVDAPTVPARQVPAPTTPTEPVEAYLVGMDGSAVLREQLADFLDVAGARRDVWVSVGVGDGSSVEWVLWNAVPYGVRALPRYPSTEPVVDTAAAVTAAASAVARDAADKPDRRRLLVLVWERPPTAVRLPASLASALVLHCVDAELDQLPPDGWGPSWLLSRSRARPHRSLLAHAGRLLTGWEPFSEVPDGLVLARLG